jgi:hypothetical protein
MTNRAWVEILPATMTFCAEFQSAAIAGRAGVVSAILAAPS